MVIGASPTLVGSLCMRTSVTLCAEREQKNPTEKPFKFCIRTSVTLCAECEQKNPIEKPFKRTSVTLCAECEQKNPIEKPFKFCIRRSVTLCAECERYIGYSMNKAFVHLRTSHVAVLWRVM